MAKIKSIEELSAKELYNLAEKREKQEQEKKAAENKAKIEDLKKQKKSLITSHRKQIAAIDRQLARLSGITVSRNSRKSTQAKAGTTDSILDLLKNHKTMTTAQIRTQLEGKGLKAKNLSQTLAYLKRTQQIKSPARSTYTLA